MTMPIAYHIYRNDGRGGDVDYSTPIATTGGLTFECGPLAAPGDTTFAVRAFDTATGLEEANTDARVRIVLDASGHDVTNRPGRVVGLSARPIRGGSCRVAWGYIPPPGSSPPSAFAVTLTEGTVPDLSRVAVIVPWGAGALGYECALSGLADNTPYVIAVRAVGPSSALEGEPEEVRVILASTPLQDVEALRDDSSG
ncbi:hypothetical protein TA3x_002282 [Tundrisphaera sp. TA3]|uniref:hypothetical protein n=1 Tax=Tundrisphaera sp. TA3 TaxID=3435775 RepID=UPI003EB9DF89